jgi:pentatricopeptide repeat protein
MDGAFRFGNAQEALSLYQEMIRLGLCPHKFTYNIIVRGFCDRGKMQVEVSFLDGVRKDDANLNAATFNALIDEYCMKNH